MLQTVFITGGSRGIGKAMVKSFAQQGYSVVFSYCTAQEKAQQLTQELTQQGYVVYCVPMDLADELAVKTAFEKAYLLLGSIGVLINNAGIAQQQLFTDITIQQWDTMFNVHVKGSFLCTQQVIKQMIHNKKGCIINMSSMWGQIGASCEVHYSAAKAAIIGFTKALAQEEGPSGIRVNCIAPGAVKTDMMKEFTTEEIQLLEQDIPLGHLATAQEIANIALFLASEKASYITGQIIGVNGGMVV